MMLETCIRHFFLLVILYDGLHLIPTVLGCEPCQFSVFTETEVSACPETQNELKIRKAKKNCEILAQHQNCTEPERFKYHCVINEHENKLIEVCAKEHRINGGQCAEYNKLGRTIQEHQISKNSTFKPKCPKTYMSSEAHLCKDCYDIVRKQKNGSCSTDPQDIPKTIILQNNTNETTNSDFNDSWCDFKVFVIVCVIAALEFLIIIFLIIKVRRQRPKQNLENGDSKFPVADHLNSTDPFLE